MKTEYELRIRYGSRDIRDGGWFEEVALGRSDDEEGLKHLAHILNEAARSLMDAFMAGPSNRTLEERFDSTKEHADVIGRWFDIRTLKDLTRPACFHVRPVPKIPVIDLSKLTAETGVPA